MNLHINSLMSREWCRVLLLAAGYLALALASRLLALPPGFASPVWPAAGLALGALVVWGWRCWPGVFLGSLIFNTGQDFFANGTIGVGVAAGIASGAALQALLGIALTRGIAAGSAPLSRTWRAVRALLYAGPLACVMSASVGVGTLYWLGRLPADGLAVQWLTWWVGDAIGVLLFAPLTILLLPGSKWSAPQRAVSIGLPLLIAGTAFVILNIGFDRMEESKVRQEAAVRAGKVIEAAGRHLPDRIEELRSVARLFSLQRDVKPDEYQTFVVPLLDLPSLVAVEWAPRARADLLEQQSDAVNDSPAQVDNAQPDSRHGQAATYAVEYVMPVAGNAIALGLEHAEEPARREAMLRAGASGNPATSAPVRLARTGALAALVFYPVYNFGLDVTSMTTEARNRMLRGYVIAIFDLQKLLAGFEGEASSNALRYRLTDLASGQSQHLGGTLNATEVPSWSGDLKFGDRIWRLELAPIPGYWQSKRSGAAQIMLVASLILMFLICLWVVNTAARSVLLVRQIRGRREAEESLRELNADLESKVAQRAEALAESEKQFRSTFDVAPVGMCHVAVDRTLLRVNARACEITGYSEQELQKLRLRDITHPDDRTLMHDDIDRLMSGEVASYRGEKRYVRKDGSLVWVRNSGSLMRDAAGKVLYRVLIIEDITAGKLAAEKREMSERRYRYMFEHNPVPMWTYDPANLEITAVNDAACNQFGYTHREFLGLTLRNLRAPQDLELLDKTLASRPTGYVGLREIRMRRKDGEIFDIEIISHETMDNGQRRRMVQGSDISERRRTETLLSGQKKVLEQIAAGAPLATTLDMLSKLIEATSPAMLGSIMLLDTRNQCLEPAAAPSLPADYVAAIAHIPIAEGVGSCGTAAFRGESVTVSDIASDPLWSDFSDLAITHGLQACWSVPILETQGGNVLGTFAVYFREPRNPAPKELQWVEALTHTAAIAITKEREQNALQDSEERHRATFEHSALAISHVNSDRRFLRVNPSMCKLLGYSEAELLQTGPGDLTHPEDIEADREMKSKLLLGGMPSYSIEKRYIRKDGTVLWANATVSPVHDRQGNVDYTIGIVQDITRRKQAEAGLHEQQELNRLLLENLAEGVVACDSEGRLIQFNKAARDWHGTDPRDLPKEQWADNFDLCAADGKTSLRTEEIPLVRAFNGEIVRNVPMSIVRKGAPPRFVLTSGVPIHDAQGNRLGAVVAMHDVTERQRSERRFANLFEFAPDAIVMANAAGTITQINRQAETLFGWLRDELVGKPVETLIPEAARGRHPALRSKFHHSTQPRAMGGGQSNLRGLRKDGTTFPVDISLSPMESDEGPMVAAAVRDISERLKADQAVRQALATLDATEDGVFIFDAETLLFNYVNEGAVKQVGYSREELCEIMPLDINPAFDAETFRQILQSLRSGQTKTRRFTTVHRHKDGHDVPVEINLQYLAPIGERARFIALVRDVTERQVTLRKLQLFNNIGEQTRTLVEPGEIMAVFTRLLGSHLGASRCAYATVESDADQFTILTDYTANCESVTGDYQLDLFGPLAVAAMRNGQTLVVRDVDAEISAIEGADMFNAIGIKAIVCCPLVKNGHLTAMMAVHQTVPRNWTPEEISIVEDVVERCWATIERERALADLHQAADELTVANAAVERERASLAERVEERTAELTATNLDLAQARDQAEAASRAKSTFLATVSHEIRTPMHGVLGAMELLERTGLEGQKGSLLTAAQRSARSLLELLNDLLDMAKIEAGRIEVLPAPVALETIVNQVVSTHLPNAITKGITLTSSIGTAVPSCVNADTLRLRQIIGNLVSNAIKFTMEGGVQIEVTAEPGTERMHRVIFIVRDTGAGIPADVLVTLFRPFEQGPAVAARKSGGTGLGLAICRGLAERMSGTVRLDSVAGQGTVATLEVDLIEVEAPSPTGEVSDEKRILANWQTEHRDDPSATVGQRILVVDDHPVNRLLLVKQLEQLGITAIAANDGVEALTKLEQGQYAAVITDCEMPEMDGYALARAIRDGKSCDKDLPIIACTAHALPEVSDRCRVSGMNDVLTKPINLAALAGTLQKWLPSADLVIDDVELPSGDGGAVFDRSQLSAISDGIPELEQEVIDEFTADCAVISAELAVALDTENDALCARLAHRGKGGSMTVGAMALAGAYAELERSSQQGVSNARLQQAMRKVEHETQRLEHFLAAASPSVND